MQHRSNVRIPSAERERLRKCYEEADMRWLTEMFLDALKEWEKNGGLGRVSTILDAGVSSVGILESRGEEW